MAPHLSRTEKSSDNALNEIFVNFDNDLHKVNDNSNVNGNLPVQEGGAIK